MGNELGKLVLDSPRGALYYNIKNNMYTLIIDEPTEYTKHKSEIVVDVKVVPYLSGTSLKVDAIDTNLSPNVEPLLWKLSNSSIFKDGTYDFLQTNVT